MIIWHAWSIFFVFFKLNINTCCITVKWFQRCWCIFLSIYIYFWIFTIILMSQLRFWRPKDCFPIRWLVPVTRYYLGWTKGRADIVSFLCTIFTNFLHFQHFPAISWNKKTLAICRWMDRTGGFPFHLISFPSISTQFHYFPSPSLYFLSYYFLSFIRVMRQKG